MEGVRKIGHLALFRKWCNTAIVTTEDEWQLVCNLSNGVIFYDLEPTFLGHASIRP